jgi:DNA-binding beta-propeller fold protein YncE
MVEYRTAIIVGVVLAVVAGSGIVFTLTSYFPSQIYSGKGVPSLSEVAVANVTIGGYPDVIAVNQNTGRIYVTDYIVNKVTVIDASSHEVIGSITLPGTPKHGIAIDTTNDILYVPVLGCTNEPNVTNSCGSTPGAYGGEIVKIDGKTNSITGEFPINVDLLAFDSSAGTLIGVYASFANHSASGFLLGIDANSGSVLANTSLGAYPISIAVNPKANMAYVLACKQVPIYCPGAELLLVNGANYALKSAVPLNYNSLNSNVVADPTTGSAYALGASTSLTLFSVDGFSGALLYSANLAGSCAGGGTLAINSASDLVYASFGGYFVVIDGTNGGIRNMISASGSIQYIAYNPATDQVYLTMGGGYQSAGYLVVLPGTTTQNHVDTSLFPRGPCRPP